MTEVIRAAAELQAFCEAESPPAGCAKLTPPFQIDSSEVRPLE